MLVFTYLLQKLATFADQFTIESFRGIVSIEIVRLKCCSLSQVAPTERSGAAPPPRTGWDGSGALVLQNGEVSAADRQSGGRAGRRPCQHARGPPHDPGPVLPPSEETGEASSNSYILT